MPKRAARRDRSQPPAESTALLAAGQVNIEDVVPMPRRALDGKDRLTLQLNVHHQHDGTQPVSFQFSKSEFLQTIEQPFIRRVTVTAERKSLLDFACWVPIDKVGKIVLQNVAKCCSGEQVLPTDEEKAELNRQIVYVYLGDAKEGWVLRPNQFPFFAEPEQAADIRLAAADKPTEVWLYIFPR